jgi:hypothetical protein
MIPVPALSTLNAQTTRDTSRAVLPDKEDDINHLYEILGHELTPVTVPKSSSTSKGKTAKAAASGTRHSGAPKPVEVSYGTIKITVDPPTAVVFVDSKSESLDDLRAGLHKEAGQHTVAASVDGYEGFLTTLSIEPNQTQTVMIALKHLDKPTGSLHVFSYPWADLYLDSAYHGTTPMPKPVVLAEGEHTLILKHAGYAPYVEMISIKKGELARLKIRLQKSL